MAGRRFLLLVAVLMGLTALAASLAPRDPVLRDRERDRAGQRSEPTATPPPPPASASTSVREETLTAGEGPQRLIAERGELIQLEVEVDAVDAVVIEGLDAVEAVAPASPARFSLLADRPGSYPIELLDAGRRIGTFVVRD